MKFGPVIGASAGSPQSSDPHGGHAIGRRQQRRLRIGTSESASFCASMIPWKTRHAKRILHARETARIKQIDRFSHIDSVYANPEY